jgi:hypothetical protein
LFFSGAHHQVYRSEFQAISQHRACALADPYETIFWHDASGSRQLASITAFFVKPGFVSRHRLGKLSVLLRRKMIELEDDDAVRLCDAGKSSR